MSREDPDAALDTDAVPLEEVYGLINSLFAEDEGDVAIEVIGEDLARSVQAYNRLKSNFFKAIKQVVVKGLVKLTAAARKAKIGSPHDLILLPEVLVMLSCPDGEVKRLRSEGFKHELFNSPLDTVGQTCLIYHQLVKLTYPPEERHHNIGGRKTAGKPADELNKLMNANRVKLEMEEVKRILDQGIDGMDSKKAKDDAKAKYRYHTNRQCTAGCARCIAAAVALGWPHTVTPLETKLEAPFVAPSKMTSQEFEIVCRHYKVGIASNAAAELQQPAPAGDAVVPAAPLPRPTQDPLQITSAATTALVAAIPGTAVPAPDPVLPAAQQPFRAEGVTAALPRAPLVDMGGQQQHGEAAIATAGGSLRAVLSGEPAATAAVRHVERLMEREERRVEMEMARLEPVGARAALSAEDEEPVTNGELPTHIPDRETGAGATAGAQGQSTPKPRRRRGRPRKEEAAVAKAAAAELGGNEAAIAVEYIENTRAEGRRKSVKRIDTNYVELPSPGQTKKAKRSKATEQASRD